MEFPEVSGNPIPNQVSHSVHIHSNIPTASSRNTWHRIATSLRHVVNTRQRTLGSNSRRIQLGHTVISQQRSNDESIHGTNELISASTQSNEAPNFVINIDHQSSPVHANPTNSPNTSNDASRTSDAEWLTDSDISDDLNEAVNVSNQPVGSDGVRNIQVENFTDLLNQFPEIRSYFLSIWHYFLFLGVIVIKVLLDHFTGLAVLIGLIAISFWTEKWAVRIASRPSNFPVRLLLVLTGIPLILTSLNFLYDQMNIYNCALLMFWCSVDELLYLWTLFWLLIVTNQILVLSTIWVKCLLIAVPNKFMTFRARGKYLALLEFTSQFIRALAPIQPWMWYLYADYSGAWTAIGVVLCAVYLVFKMPDLLMRFRNLKEAVLKVWHTVDIFQAPTKLQLETAGSQCPICHDVFTNATLLKCRHIFCELCVTTWLMKERTCPLCRTQVAEDPLWCDGATCFLPQLV